MKHGYRHSEVGIIPKDWDIKTLFNVAPLQRGFDLPSREIKNGTFPVVYSNGIENYHHMSMATGPGVITGRSGTLGKVHFIESDYWPHNTTLWVTKFNENDPRFIYYFYKFISFDRFASGSGVPTLNRNDLHSFKVALPKNITEQKRIAEVLYDFDKILKSLEILIEKKKNIKQGIMFQLLTGQKRLPGFSKKWKVKQLSELLVYEQPTKYLVNSSNYNDVFDTPVLTAGKTFYLGYTNEEDGVYKDLPAIIFDDFTTVSKYVNFEFKVKSSAIKILTLKDKSSNLEFIFQLMQIIGFKVGEHKRHWISQYSKIEVTMPEKNEQDEIVKILSDADSEIQSFKAKRDKLNNLKLSTMQELLTGKTRLAKLDLIHD